MARFGVCVLCHQPGELTDEHYIAKRFRKLFALAAKGSPDYTQVIGTVFPITGTVKHLPERRIRSPWGAPVGDVCKKRCNGGWMNDMDERVEPMLTHFVRGTSPLRLTVGDQRALAGWFAKVLMMHELTDPDSASFTGEQRDWVREHGSPPPGSWYLIGTYSGAAMLGLPTLTHRPILVGSPRPIDIAAPPRFNAHHSFLVFGHVLLTGTGGAPLPQPPSWDAVFRPRLRPIWPNPRPFRWPVAPTFDDGIARDWGEAVVQGL